MVKCPTESSERYKFGSNTALWGCHTRRWCIWSEEQSAHGVICVHHPQDARQWSEGERSIPSGCSQWWLCQVAAESIGGGSAPQWSGSFYHQTTLASARFPSPVPQSSQSALRHDISLHCLVKILFQPEPCFLSLKTTCTGYRGRLCTKIIQKHLPLPNSSLVTWGKKWPFSLLRTALQMSSYWKEQNTAFGSPE